MNALKAKRMNKYFCIRWKFELSAGVVVVLLIAHCGLAGGVWDPSRC
jgi:hypothetical protein